MQPIRNPLQSIGIRNQIPIRNTFQPAGIRNQIPAQNTFQSAGNQIRNNLQSVGIRNQMQPIRNNLQSVAIRNQMPAVRNNLQSVAIRNQMQPIRNALRAVGIQNQSSSSRPVLQFRPTGNVQIQTSISAPTRMPRFPPSSNPGPPRMGSNVRMMQVPVSSSFRSPSPLNPPPSSQVFQVCYLAEKLE